MSFHQPFVCSYPRDYVWLEHLLWSLHKFGQDLEPPVVCVASEDRMSAQTLCEMVHPEARVVTKDGPPGRGMMRAMGAMMSADLLCPDAKFVWLFGSDCFLTEKLNPADFFESGNPVICYTPYQKFLGLYPGGLKWQAGVERIMGLLPEHEFMRRLPGVYHVDMLSGTREFIERRHRMPLDQFIASYRADDFSEANLIGAYVWEFMRYRATWQRTEFNPCLQFWSHGGLDRPCDGDVMYFGGNARTKTPRQIIEETRKR